MRPTTLPLLSETVPLLSETVPLLSDVVDWWEAPKSRGLCA